MIVMDKSKTFLGWNEPGKAFITGASSGIGASFAKALARRGFDLVLLSRRREKLQDLSDRLEKECAVRCEIVCADLADTKEIVRTANHLRQIDHLDILINNAGFATIGNFANVPLEKSMRMFELHMAATVRLTHAALQSMREQKRGAIINVSSMGSFILTPGNVLYDATKSFLNTFSENLSLELADTGIRIQALCPNFTRTEFHEVGDFKNFDRAAIPDFLWMMPDDVVSASLAALEDNEPPVFIPGRKNRLIKWIVLHSSMFRSRMQRKVKEREKVQ